METINEKIFDFHYLQLSFLYRVGQPQDSLDDTYNIEKVPVSLLNNKLD